MNDLLVTESFSPGSRSDEASEAIQRAVRPVAAGRLLSLDAYRGAIMVFLTSSALGLGEVARHFPGSSWWRFLGTQSDHTDWIGCTLWDLIQPAFMFMVGVAVPWSLAKRRAQNEAFQKLLGHAVWRSILLVLLGVFLASAWSNRTEWVFTSVLQQIGLGYTFLFLIAYAKPRVQWLAAFSVLFVYWLVFALYPLPAAGFDWAEVGVSPGWSHLSGFAAHWDKNANFAAAFDRWLLNLFPRETPYQFNSGGYQTLNFVPSLVTMIFGLLAGQLLQRDLPISEKIKRLVLFGIAGVALGEAISWVGLCPVVKRIWTPSWTLYSGGLVTLFLAGFVAIIEWRGWKRWAFPFVVVGLNPIAIYCMWQLMGSSVRQNLQTHLGRHFFEAFGPAYAPILGHGTVFLFYWLVLLWMYRKKIYLRI